jgi:hypothetical protein
VCVCVCVCEGLSVKWLFVLTMGAFIGISQSRKGLFVCRSLCLSVCLSEQMMYIIHTSCVANVLLMIC